MDFFIQLFCIFFSLCSFNCAPIKDPNSEQFDVYGINGSSSVLNFLRNFGYLEQGRTNESEALYSEQRISQAVRLMQRFGAIPETGLFDNQTLSLLTKPRCGLQDVNSNSFTLGSKGWNKRRLTYRLENYPEQLHPQDLNFELKKAFDVWGKYSNLRFLNKQVGEADILVSFGRSNHGDNFPFDGKGGTLAHAFFPQNTKGLGGDIHFDKDEDWVTSKDVLKRNRGISFLEVAVHELGHSLGLGHSPDVTSVMFPYYQVPKESGEPKLGNDDIMALYHLYITRNIEDYPRDEEKIPERTSTTTTSKPPLTITPRYSFEEDEPSTPSLCQGQFDTISFLRNEIFIFNQDLMWRLTDKGIISSPSYPAKTKRLFPFLKDVSKIDAAFERESDSKLVFISGKSYYLFDGTSEGQGPLPLTDFGLPSSLTGVDAAFVWGKNKKTYFFKDNLYWKYDENIQRIFEGYPKEIKENWKGAPNNLTSILTFRDDKTYIFKENEFWRFNDVEVKTEEGFPMNLKNTWFNC